jgi:probable HAF family extracellular repeat protein
MTRTTNRSFVKLLAQTLAPTVAVLCLLAPALAAARAQQEKHPKARYTVKDLGTLGGSFAEAGGISNDGWVEGLSTLPGDNVFHAFRWRDGVMMDLGNLGGLNSFSEWQPNDFGNVGGYSETSVLDPNGEDNCGFGTGLICQAFFFDHGAMIAQPALGGNNSQGYGTNDLGEMAGLAENNFHDPDCEGTGQVLQYKPVIWRAGRVHELPTVGGDGVGVAFAINDLDEAVGQTGPCSGETAHGVLWKNGKAIDLGNLGGTAMNSPQGLNDFGQIVGFSSLAGDATFHAFLWQRGVMTDLGTLPGDVHSVAETINSSGQIVGRSSDANFNGRGVVWLNGVIIDFNTLIPANSPLFIWECTSNNDLGQIVGIATEISTGNMHAFLATPIKGGEGALLAGEHFQRPNVTLPENIQKFLQSRKRMAKSRFVY